MDYRASWGGAGRRVEVEVRWNTDSDLDGLFVAVVDGVPVSIEDEGDLLDLAPHGAEVAFERGGVQVRMRKADQETFVRASTVLGGRVLDGPEVSDGSTWQAIERA